MQIKVKRAIKQKQRQFFLLEEAKEEAEGIPSARPPAERQQNSNPFQIEWAYVQRDIKSRRNNHNPLFSVSFFLLLDFSRSRHTICGEEIRHTLRLVAAVLGLEILKIDHILLVLVGLLVL